MEKNKTSTQLIKDVGISPFGSRNGVIDILETDKILYSGCVIRNVKIAVRFYPNDIIFHLCTLVDCEIIAPDDAPMRVVLRGNSKMIGGTYNGSPVAEFRTSW